MNTLGHCNTTSKAPNRPPATTIAVAGDDSITPGELITLASQCSLPLLSNLTDSDASPNFLLYQSQERLEIRSTTDNTAIFADFVEGKTRHRRLQGGGKGQDIAKAIGFHKIKQPTIIDATAGLGGDSFVLASLGGIVTLLERQTCIHALLDNAITRASQTDEQSLIGIIQRMKLIHISAQTYLQSLSEADYPDVIFLDPMFPERKKTALVKKEMQFFHQLVGNDEDSADLLALALSKAKKRIVVKRPRLAPYLNHQTADFFIKGKTTRYDVYLPKQ